jgi:hypothetical protein
VVDFNILGRAKKLSIPQSLYYDHPHQFHQPGIATTVPQGRVDALAHNIPQMPKIFSRDRLNSHFYAEMAELLADGQLFGQVRLALVLSIALEAMEQYARAMRINANEKIDNTADMHDAVGRILAALTLQNVITAQDRFMLIKSALSFARNNISTPPDFARLCQRTFRFVNDQDLSLLQQDAGVETLVTQLRPLAREYGISLFVSGDNSHWTVQC